MEAQDYVKELLAAGLTQTVIAERSGIPQPTISKIARGDVADVMSRNYRRLQAVHAEVLAGTERGPASPDQRAAA
jgi:transcriptional regulator with XRE-family HTH domain